MTKSEFQFTNPILLNIQFDVHEEFNDNVELQIPIQFAASNNWDKKSEEAAAKLKISMGEENNKYPYYLTATMAANFKWNAANFVPEAIENLLDRNAPALLLAYARPIIANITNSSPFPVQNLAYFDFTK